MVRSSVIVAMTMFSFITTVLNHTTPPEASVVGSRSSFWNLNGHLPCNVDELFHGAAGIYIGDTDDAPGAALIGILLMIGAVVLGVRTARRKP